MDDAALVAAAVDGDADAFRRLVERYQRPVYGLILRMVRDPGEAEDLAQESFLKAYRALRSFDRRRRFSSWLFKIAHNATIDRLRRARVSTVPLESDDDERRDPAATAAVPEHESPEARLRTRDLAEALEAALAGLRPEYRDAVVLRFQEGLAYDEIAAVLELPLGTVKTHLHRARRQLASALRAGGWDLAAGPAKRRRQGET